MKEGLYEGKKDYRHMKKEKVTWRIKKRAHCMKVM